MSFKWKQSQKREVRTARAEAESAGRVEASLAGRRRRLGWRFLALQAQRYGGVGVPPASGFTMLGRQIITAGPKGKAITFYA